MGYHTFGAIVAELRKGQFGVGTGKALTQQRLAQQIGVSPRLVEAIEQGSKSYLIAIPPISKRSFNIFVIYHISRPYGYKASKPSRTSTAMYR